jgi:hypothetical protein
MLQRPVALCRSGFLHIFSTLYPQKLAITSLTSGGRSVGIVRSRTQTMEFSFSLVLREASVVVVVVQSSSLHCKYIHYMFRRAVSVVWWSEFWLQIQRSGFDSRRYQIF